jgi:hypothetical protein
VVSSIQERCIIRSNQEVVASDNNSSISPSIYSSAIADIVSHIRADANKSVHLTSTTLMVNKQKLNIDVAMFNKVPNTSELALLMCAIEFPALLDGDMESTYQLVKRLLSEDLISLMSTYVDSVSSCRSSDARRGAAIIPDYEFTHDKIDDDQVISQLRSKTEQVCAMITEIFK